MGEAEQNDEKVRSRDLAGAQAQTPRRRQVVIETDGNTVNLAKAEVASNLELIAILSLLLERLKK